MSILEHIAELRDRLVRSIAALFITTIGAFVWLYNPLLHFLTRAYCHIPLKYLPPGTTPDNCKLLVLGPMGGFSARIRVALTAGLVLAMPYIAFQLWRFITPGLKPSEKRYAIPFSLATTILFAMGVAVAFGTLPKALGFLVAIGGDNFAFFLQADQYLRFVLFMGLAFGLTFEFPLVLVFLAMVGVLSSGAMLRAWRPAIAVIIVVAAVVTPSQDPISLFAMAVPMWIFYFAAAGVAKFLIEPARARRRTQMERGS
jgi:Tat protein translocase TatC